MRPNREDSTAFDLVCFSHLRWDLVFHRPRQHWFNTPTALPMAAELSARACLYDYLPAINSPEREVG
jgi:hypothetical protein